MRDEKNDLDQYDDSADESHEEVANRHGDSTKPCARPDLKDVKTGEGQSRGREDNEEDKADESISPHQLRAVLQCLCLDQQRDPATSEDRADDEGGPGHDEKDMNS